MKFSLHLWLTFPPLCSCNYSPLARSQWDKKNLVVDLDLLLLTDVALSELTDAIYRTDPKKHWRVCIIYTSRRVNIESRFKKKQNKKHQNSPLRLRRVYVWMFGWRDVNGKTDTKALIVTKIMWLFTVFTGHYSMMSILFFFFFTSERTGGC